MKINKWIIHPYQFRLMKEQTIEALDCDICGPGVWRNDAVETKHLANRKKVWYCPNCFRKTRYFKWRKNNFANYIL